MSMRRVVVSACVVVVVLTGATWSSIAAFPTQVDGSAVVQTQPGPMEQVATLTSPENPVPTLVHLERAMRPPVANAENADVAVTLRTVVDGAGNVAEVRLTSFTFRLEGQSATLMGGPESVAAFPYPLLRDFIEAAAHAVRQTRYDRPTAAPSVFTTITQFTTRDPLATSRASPIVQRVSAEGALKVDGNIKPPTKIKDVRPVYPPEARDARVQGVVILEVRIEADGRVGSAAVLRSIPMLDQAALDAVHQWEFTPTLLNGVAIPLIMTVTVQFTLQ